MEDRKTLHSECKTAEVHPSDFYFLTDENFDFDLSLSPKSENEDEVFIGPMGHKEKCIAVSFETHEENENKIPSLTDDPEWSPPAGVKFVEIFKEAHFVAIQLKSGSKTRKNDTVHLGEQKTEVVENFVKESKSKLTILEKGIVTDKTPAAITRETYCIWESPSGQLLPSIQKHSGQSVTITDSCDFPQMPLNTSNLVKTDKLPKTATVSSAQAKNDANLKKRSKFQTVKTPPALRNNSYLAEGEPKQGKLFDPSNRIYSNSMGSSEDLLSDKSSIALDAGESFSTSSSLESKRTLPTPHKLGMKTRQLKPPNVHMRRNTSSSSSISSMNSSLNSSLSISPKRGNRPDQLVIIDGNMNSAHSQKILKENVCPSVHDLKLKHIWVMQHDSPPKHTSIEPVKTSITKAPAGISRHHSGTSKISIVKPMKGFSVTAPQSDASGKQCGTKGNLLNIPKYKPTLISETASSKLQKGHSDPSLLKLLPKNTLGNASSSPKLNSKTASLSVKNENEATAVLQSNPMLFCSNIGSNIAVSPPIKQLEGTVLKSCSTVKPALWTPNKRHSALPTPVGRCISGIPTLTSKTVPRTITSPNLLTLRHVSSVSSKKTPGISSKWVSSNSSSTEGDLSPPQVIPIALDFSPDKPFIKIEQDMTKKGEVAEVILAKESLLIEFETNKTSVAVQECENKPLIDLFNTPEIIKAPPLKPTSQLIDLSSPLMKLSPEGNKENSPLLKF